MISSWRGLARIATVICESNLPFLEATRRMFCSSGRFRSIIPFASLSTTNFSIYISGARKKVFLPPAASTAIAPACPIAVIRVPSIGSTAIATSSSCGSERPTFSPI